MFCPTLAVGQFLRLDPGLYGAGKRSNGTDDGGGLSAPLVASLASFPTVESSLDCVSEEVGGG